jgi:hypothetical protein
MLCQEASRKRDVRFEKTSTAKAWGRLYKTLNHFFNHYVVVKWVRIKRGYGRTDGWMDGGRTDG